MAVSIFLLCPFAAYSQQSSHAIEIGLGGSAINHTRNMVSDFHQTPGGDYVFTLEEKLLYGGVNLYSAYELKDWLYVDLQGTLGLARYYDQFRPFTGSEWVQPYLRIGLNYYHKNFPAYYFARFSGDVTKEAVWKAEDAWNKGMTFDVNDYLPLTAGIGVVGWLGERVGIRIGADYMRSLGSKGANLPQGRLEWCSGWEEKARGEHRRESRLWLRRLLRKRLSERSLSKK